MCPARMFKMLLTFLASVHCLSLLQLKSDSADSVETMDCDAELVREDAVELQLTAIDVRNSLDSTLVDNSVRVLSQESPIQGQVRKYIFFTKVCSRYFIEKLQLL